MHARRDERHRLALLASDLNAADGAPIAWTLAAKGRTTQQRVDGPSLMWRLCGDAAVQGIRVGLYGSTPATVEALAERLQRRWPSLQLAYRHAPPFRPLDDAEDAAVCAAIAAAGVGLLFVGLGCPKQEHWMAAHRGRIPAVMLGVGAAFDFLSGAVARAPGWMRAGGLEWLHRFGQQPRRMGRRYVMTNSLFLTKTAREITRALAPAARRQRRAARHASFDDDALQTVIQPYAGNGVFDAGPWRMRGRSRNDPCPFEQLATRIDSHVPADAPHHGGGRMIGFIASVGGEGTSTVARAYVAATAGRMARRVLLLETGGDGRGSGLLQALAARRPLDALIQPLAGGGLVASLGGQDAQRATSELSARPELWAELRLHFDDIVLDLPARRASAIGLSLASLCDGVVLVLEGGRTRATVAQQLLGELRSVRANVLGTVLNKRRYYVPERIYGWL